MKKYNFIALFAILLAGSIFAAAVAVMTLRGHVNLDNFYDTGTIYEVPYSNYCQNGTGWEYDSQQGKSFISAESASYEISLLQSDFGWKYLNIRLKDLSVPEIYWQILFFNEVSECVGMQDCRLTEGMNEIVIDAGEFKRMQIIMEQQTGVEFSLLKVMLFEKEPYFSLQKFVIFFMLYFALFVVCAGLVWRTSANRGWKIDWYVPVEWCEAGYIFLAELICEKWPGIKRLTRDYRNRMRIGLFLLMFVVMTVIDNTANYKKVGYNYLLIFCSLILLAIAVISVERPVRKRNWKQPLVAFWYLLWIMACISDFIVDKGFHYTGYLMIFVVGFFFFIWGNMRHRMDMLLDMRKAVMFSYPVALAFSFFFRPFLEGYRYSGVSNNPIPFAIYLTMVLVSFYADILRTLRDQTWTWKNVWYLIAVLSALYLAWKSQSTFALGTLALVSVYFFGYGIFLTFRKKKGIFCAYLLLAVALLLPVWYGVDWGIRNISNKFGTQIIYDNDFYTVEVAFELPWETTVNAAVSEENRVLDKVFRSRNLEQLTSGRTLYYKAYLREMNLWGHSASAFFLGEKHQAHNAIIMIAHRYGVFAAVPYAMMMILFLGSAIRILKKHRYSVGAWYLFTISWSVGLMLMFDNLEQPFRWISWPLYFLGMGYCFVQNEDVANKP